MLWVAMHQIGSHAISLIGMRVHPMQCFSQRFVDITQIVSMTYDLRLFQATLRLCSTLRHANVLN